MASFFETPATSMLALLNEAGLQGKLKITISIGSYGGVDGEEVTITPPGDDERHWVLERIVLPLLHCEAAEEAMRAEDAIQRIRSTVRGGTPLPTWAAGSGAD